MRITHASLFTGIGGFDLAAEWLGWENIFQCEKDEFCNKVLEKHFPDTIRHGDIKEFDAREYEGAVDVVSGGFPCQPFSVAGKRGGQSDDRALWPEMYRVIREVKPSYVVAENVPGLLSISGGVVFEQVCIDLENAGYEVQPLVIPAAGVEAIHKRDRLWIVAYANRYGHRSNNELGQTGLAESKGVEIGNQRQRIRGELGRISKEALSANGNGSRLEGCRSEQRPRIQFTPVVPFPNEPPVLGGNDGVPCWVDRVKSLGNSIVPQVAHEIFKAINQQLKSK